MGDALQAAWDRVAEAGRVLENQDLRTLFQQDPSRVERFSATFDDLYLDLSKERIDAAALEALFALAEASGLEAQRDRLFAGEKINLTEQRAVLHMALRGGVDAEVAVDGTAVLPEVEATRRRFLAFAEDVRNGRYLSVAGEHFTDVVNIGIGGSDLGPAMAVRALTPDLDGPALHFVSNVDGAHLTDVLRPLNPARTLVVVASKTFTTQETMRNAKSARSWLQQALGEGAGHHLAAVSTNLAATEAFGIAESRVFGFWDWVGGRYSLWSAIGLPLAIAIGAERFEAFLAGAAAMDRHFRQTPLAKNLPVLLALIGIWRRNVLGCPTVALIPYDQRLDRFPAYVQQLDMESNGKRITCDGAVVRRSSGPIIWGEPGTNAQHSFLQLLHQGTDIVPVDFIAEAEPREDLADHHAMLLANCFAQAQALAFGKTEAEVRAEMVEEGRSAEDIDRLALHRSFPGNRPSTVILQRRLDPYSLGRLIALFEHKVFCQGVLWQVNSFDQWGVELGKVLAQALIPVIKGEKGCEGLDPSTASLISRAKALRQG
ncbi:MAG: glucose-6-phosphate isomerase [Kiloniellales bacterium]